MKKSSCFCSVILCLFLFLSPAHPSGFPVTPPFSWPVIPVSYTLSNKPTVLYLPNSCSGLINDAVAGEGGLNVAVQGKIQNGQLSVQVKVGYQGSVITTVGSVIYHVNGNMAALETKDISTGPVDVFVKGFFKLESKNKSSSLYISDIGYITVYPDGTVINHILDPHNDPEYSRPKVFCSNPPGL